MRAHTRAYISLIASRVYRNKLENGAIAGTASYGAFSNHEPRATDLPELQLLPNTRYSYNNC